MTFSRDRDLDVIDGAFILRILRRWRWLVLAVFVICAGSGYLWASSQPESVELQSVVRFAMTDAGQPLSPELSAYKAQNVFLPSLIKAVDKTLSPRIWHIRAADVLPILTLTARANTNNRQSVEKIQGMLVERIVSSQSDLLSAIRADLDAEALRADEKIETLQADLNDIEQKIADSKAEVMGGDALQMRVLHDLGRHALDEQRFNVRGSLWEAHAERNAATRQIARLRAPEVIQPLEVIVRPAVLSGGLALFVFGTLGLVFGALTAFVGEFLRCSIANFKRVPSAGS